MKYKERIRMREENRLVKICWTEKRNVIKKELYSKERERYYNKNGWGFEGIEEWRNMGISVERMIIERERDIQKQWEERKIKQAGYNKKYGKIGIKEGKPRYVERKNPENIKIGDWVRALIRTRCGNIEENNKYWIDEEYKQCVFCKKEKDNWEHYVKECIEVSECLIEIRRFNRDKEKCGRKIARIWEDTLDDRKGKIF